MTNELDFDSYIRAGEPEKSEKSRAWAAAIGLQAVDGLKPSAYLYDVARRNIEGDITMEQAGRLVDAYYESKTVRADDGARTEEADKVSARIAQILSEKSFNFSPSYYIAIHKRLFEGVYKFAGMLRDYDITKKEWVLDGDTVLYGSAFELKAALDYDFDLERNFSYKNLSQEDVLHHLAQFVAHVWQIHAFGEGNTRTTAVFFIKYVRSLGYDATNDMFMEHSWYFRNALVRANYRNLDKDILETTDYLELFLRNLLFKERNELKNRYMHIRADEIFELQKSSDKTFEN